MLPSTGLALLVSSVLVAAQVYDPLLVGTWSSKSNKTLTGPVRSLNSPVAASNMWVATYEAFQGFYDPVHDKLIEPSHTGVSYSFTGDGFYEEAYYRAIANRMRTTLSRGIHR